MFRFVPFFVDCGLGIPYVHRVSHCDLPVHQTVVEVGQVSSFQRWDPHVFVFFPRSLRFLQTFIASAFTEQLSDGMASSFFEHPSW